MNRYGYRTQTEVQELATLLSTYGAKLASVGSMMSQKDIDRIYCSHDNAFAVLQSNVTGFYSAIDKAVTAFPNHRPKDDEDRKLMEKQRAAARKRKATKPRK